MNQKIYASRKDFGRGISITLVDEQSNGVWVGEPVLMTRLKNDYEHVQPTMNIENDTAQQLMDQLWQCGLRPSEGTGSAGSLAATQAHLEDMKTIAFSALNKVGVKTGE